MQKIRRSCVTCLKIRCWLQKSCGIEKFIWDQIRHIVPFHPFVGEILILWCKPHSILLDIVDRILGGSFHPLPDICNLLIFIGGLKVYTLDQGRFKNHIVFISGVIFRHLSVAYLARGCLLHMVTFEYQAFAVIFCHAVDTLKVRHIFACDFRKNHWFNPAVDDPVKHSRAVLRCKPGRDSPDYIVHI